MLLNGKFDDFTKELISIEEKFDTTAREICIKMEQIEKTPKLMLAITVMRQSLKFEMKEQS